MPSVAQQFARTLKEIGVRFVFGVPSGNMTDYIEALRKEDGIDFVLVGHETTAAFMAGVCGRLTRVPGVCFGTFGPGATNLATGVGGAYLDRFPMIAFTDEMPGHLLARTVQMNIDHQALFEPITKFTTRIDCTNINETILQAAGISMTDVYGPVHIGVPAGIGSIRAEEPELPVKYLRLEKHTTKHDVLESLELAKGLIKKAKKPILVIGLRAVGFHVENQIRTLAESMNTPVILTPMAKGMFPEKNPLYAGVLFHALCNKVNEICKESDLVIGIGYDPVELLYEEWMPKIPLLHLSNQIADIDREDYVDVTNVVGEIPGILDDLIRVSMDRKNWDTKVLVNAKNAMFSHFNPEADVFGPLAVVHELRKRLPGDGILTVDVGAHLHLMGQMWHTPTPDKLLMTNGWSSMGFAIPAALAAKLCHPDLPVAAVMGDGGFYMTAGELATAKRLNLKIVFIVIYDNSLSLIRIKQEKKNFDGIYGTQLDSIQKEATNHYFGVPVKRVSNTSDYKKALKWAFDFDGPTVIEAVADGREYDNLVLKR
mgnify:CR=1 FL=1